MSDGTYAGDVTSAEAFEILQGDDQAVLVDRLDGRDTELERRAFPALLEIVRGKLAIVKPGHDDYDFAGELDA